MVLLVRIKMNQANYKGFAEDGILNIGYGVVMSARSKIMMVLSKKWLKNLLMHKLNYVILYIKKTNISVVPNGGHWRHTNPQHEQNPDSD